MKKLILSSIVFCSSSLFAEIPQENQLKTIYYDNFLEAEDCALMFDGLASFVSGIAGEGTLSQEEIVKRYQELAHSQEVENQNLELIASMLNEDELENICELIQNPLYMQYRFLLMQVNTALFQEAMDSMEKIVMDLTKSAESKVQTPKELTQVTMDNFHTILSSSEFVILDVYADWCGPCKRVKPILEGLNAEYGDLYHFCKMNAEMEDELSTQLEITAFPTFIFFKDGVEVGRKVGFFSRNDFLSDINKYFG